MSISRPFADKIIRAHQCYFEGPSSVHAPYQVREKHLFYGSLPALGIGAASFWSVAEKDIAESPTASPERPKTIHNSQCIMHNF